MKQSAQPVIETFQLSFCPSSVFFLLKPFVSSLFLCELVQLFCFSLLLDQSGSFTFLLFLISSLFPNDPLFFPPPLHCCLSEKEVQLECLFDGEIGSCRFRSFLILCLSESLSPPVLPSLLSVFLWLFFLLGRDAWGVVLDRLRLVRFLSIQHPCIPL